MASVKELVITHKVTIGIALALVVTGWLCWYFSDTQVIKRQLIGLTWEVNKKNSQESTIETALKMREVKAALAADCRVTVQSRINETIERDIAITYLMYYRDRYETIAVSFKQIDIQFPVKGEAAVQVSVLLKRQKPQVAATEVTAPVMLRLKKQDGNWLLTQAEIALALVDD